MTKRELIDQITRLNPTAMPAFLAGFKDGELDEYLKHLRWASAPQVAFRAVAGGRMLSPSQAQAAEPVLDSESEFQVAAAVEPAGMDLPQAPAPEDYSPCQSSEATTTLAQDAPATDSAEMAQPDQDMQECPQPPAQEFPQQEATTTALAVIEKYRPVAPPFAPKYNRQEETESWLF
jgi:hypothetical protein